MRVKLTLCQLLRWCALVDLTLEEGDEELGGFVDGSGFRAEKECACAGEGRMRKELAWVLEKDNLRVDNENLLEARGEKRQRLTLPRLLESRVATCVIFELAVIFGLARPQMKAQERVGWVVLWGVTTAIMAVLFFYLVAEPTL